ncbi:PepSY-like domain-containing protein [Campylobacter sp. MIT 21-1685]|uniref:PepSY-like domain-containing protein n=1 Tax=unclassified Campylobacter TaxID=2593542 RepID=UPI00224AF021|nr:MULTISPECIES: PepSY-like domain-containing protein [unclassified Campylobacter]MCX2682752.1 PepSY-like domain-containing protein [Campylobacter sp. MIT 21-1684]MCX2751102.1 PepSY-like domain-containing protein [Campylobacter sp. MIT 21-1682]MCX2807233.1 PepSY-like domain-containing protein [Campylobacter sp. MIT 21-1685]
MKLVFLIFALSLLAFANPLLNTQNATSNATTQQNPPVTSYQQVPAYPQNYALPPKIMQQINSMYPGVFIKDIDWKAYGYEVELSNYMELFFDRQGNLLGQKFDD